MSVNRAPEKHWT